MSSLRKQLREHYQVPPDKKLRLSARDPDNLYGVPDGKDQGLELRDTLTERLGELQNLLYAQQKHRVLVILQGMDTSGKDSTIRRVFRVVDPLGVRVASFRAPNKDEITRDYLWRVHRRVPSNGELVIFNRSHYEDVLVARVRRLVPKRQWRKRYDHINDFERMLTDEGTTILKFFLHISHEEQKRRLQRRLEDPTKHWKFDISDINERSFWPEYVRAYEEAISRTSTPWAPWYVIPANHKWYRDVAVAGILVDTLNALRMRFPPPPPGLDEIVLE
ncbi:MAG: polyphosphate kinase 2 family protein [Pseudomonadota bacterium]|nr:polyphosphate kinase 2 family protein [Pseudomonadota bacterium]